MNDLTRIDEALSQAAGQLAGVSDSPRLDAELMLSRALDVNRSYLFAHPEDRLDALAGERFDAMLARRLAGEPLAYLEGRKEFWSMSLVVGPQTLVPRPETETLVQQALALMTSDPLRVLDLGTGSGAIALAIANERPDCEVTATDSSGDALAIARENARRLDIINVQFAQGWWLDAVPGRQFDIIVSNPPYVSAADPALEKLTFEPRQALVSGADGLDDIRLLATDCAGALAPGGWLLLEHGADQEGAVAELLAGAGWQNIACHRDLAGLPRVTAARSAAD